MNPGTGRQISMRMNFAFGGDEVHRRKLIYAGILYSPIGYVYYVFSHLQS